MSTFLIGMALVGTQGTQAQVTLNTAAASFISNINFVKNNAIAGSVSLGTPTVNPSQQWVYGFAIFPGALSLTPSSDPGLCPYANIDCSPGYYTAIIAKGITTFPGSGIPTCKDNSVLPYENSAPPTNNLLNNVNNLNSCAYPGNHIYIGRTPRIFSHTDTHNPRTGDWVYYNAFPTGVSISYQSSSSHEYFPVFQELTGYLYLYDLNTGELITNPSSTSLSVIFNLSYEGYTIPITFYDLYNSGPDSNTFSEGNIINNG